MVHMIVFLQKKNVIHIVVDSYKMYSMCVYTISATSV